MKILDYEMIAVSATDSVKLEARVRDRLKSGWEVYGTPMLGSPRGAGANIFQCMVLADPVGRKSCRWVSPTATEPGRWEPVNKESAPS
jgi:hypothetical protein